MPIPAILAAVGRVAGSGAARGAVGKAVRGGAGSFVRGTAVSTGKKGYPVAQPVGKEPGFFDKAADFGFKAQGASAAISTVAGVLGKVADVSLKASNPLYGFGKAAEVASATFGTAVEAVVGPMKAGVAAMGSMHDAVASLGRATGEYVKHYSPADARKFEFAEKDSKAGIGKSILPVDHFATSIMGGWRDITAKMSGPISNALGSVFDPLTKAMPKLVDATAPLLKMFGRWYEGLGKIVSSFMGTSGDMGDRISMLQVGFENFADNVTPVLDLIVLLGRVAGETFSKMSRWAMGSLKDFMSVLGLKTKPKTVDKVTGAGVGLAVTSAQVGSVDSLFTKAITSAFMQGAGGKKEEDYEKTTASATTQILAKLEEWWGDFQDWMDELPDKLAEAIRQNLPGGETAAKVMNGDLSGATSGAWDEAKQSWQRLQQRWGI